MRKAVIKNRLATILIAVMIAVTALGGWASLIWTGLGGRQLR